jgi:cyclic lactone autoinducer peptide
MSLYEKICEVRKMKTAAMKKIAAVVEKIARVGAGRACMGHWHQPKVPEALRQSK